MRLRSRGCEATGDVQMIFRGLFLNHPSCHPSCAAGHQSLGNRTLGCCASLHTHTHFRCVVHIKHRPFVAS